MTRLLNDFILVRIKILCEFDVIICIWVPGFNYFFHRNTMVDEGFILRLLTDNNAIYIIVIQRWRIYSTIGENAITSRVWQ